MKLAESILSKLGENTLPEIIDISEKFSKSQMKRLKDEWGSVDRINPTSPTYSKLEKFIKDMPTEGLKQIVEENVKFLHTLAESELRKRGETSFLKKVGR